MRNRLLILLVVAMLLVIMAFATGCGFVEKQSKGSDLRAIFNIQGFWYDVRIEDYSTGIYNDYVTITFPNGSEITLSLDNCIIYKGDFEEALR